MANLSNINGKFVVEQTTGYVGVGTTDPNYPIEVLNASAEIALNASGGSIYRVQSDSASNFIIRKEGVGDRLVINSSGNSTFAGTIITPQINLYGVGTTYLNIGNATTGTTSSDGASIGFYTGQTSLQIVNRENDAIVLSTNNSPSVTILGNGNVGIGTTNIGTQSNLYLGASSSSEGGQLTLQKATGGTLAAHIDAYTSGGSDFMRVLSGTDTATTAAPFVFDLTSTRLGIGTTGPGVPLDVVGDIRTATRYLISTGTANQNMAIGYWDGSNARIEAGSALPMLITSYQGNIKLGITGGTTMTIQSSNVGIGVTSPSQKLQVDGGATGFNQGIPATSGTTQNGMLRLTSGSSVYGETFDFGMNVAPTYAWIQATNKGSLAVNYNLALNPNGGNVGIGTAGPSKKLEVAGSYKLGTNAWIQYDAVYPYTISMLNGAGIGNLILNAGYGSSGYESKIELQGSNTVGAAGITLSTGSSPRIVVTADGNVGIGVTGPIAQLDVAGNTNQHHSVSTNNNGGWRSIQNLGVTSWLDQTYSAGRLKVFGYENGNVNVSYCEYYVIRSSTGYYIQQIGTRLDVGNTHGQVECRVSGNFLQIRNVAQSSLGIVRVVFSGMKN